MSDGELRWAWRTHRNLCILYQRESWIERQYQIVIHTEEDDSAVLKLCADDPLRRQTQTILVKGERPLQIANGQCDDLDTWIHRNSFLGLSTARRHRYATCEAQRIGFYPPCGSRVDKISWTEPLDSVPRGLGFVRRSRRRAEGDALHRLGWWTRMVCPDRGRGHSRDEFYYDRRPCEGQRELWGRALPIQARCGLGPSGCGVILAFTMGEAVPVRVGAGVGAKCRCAGARCGSGGRG